MNATILERYEKKSTNTNVEIMKNYKVKNSIGVQLKIVEKNDEKLNKI